MSRIHQKQKQLKILTIALVLGLTVLLFFLLANWFNSELWHWLLCLFVSVNLVTWLVFFYDKKISSHEESVRVPENVMFVLAVAGGLPSTLVAMQVLRHKRAKPTFKWKLFLWFVLTYSIIGMIVWFWNSR